MSTPILVDTNVLIDIATENPQWFAWSSAALIEAGERRQLATNPVIYAEFSVPFERIEQVERALSGLDLARLPLPFEAAFLAGKAYLRYRNASGRKLAPLPDFFIGAHAAVAGLGLLTRDARRYRTYFPRLELIAPN